MANNTAWKNDNYKFVGKAFDSAYANRLNKLLPILGEVTTRSIDYEIVGDGGYGELTPYDGTNLNEGKQSRGFRTIITTQEFSKSIPVRYKQAKVDKSGTCKKVGKRLGDSAAMTVYLHALRMFARATNALYLGGDGKPWAATDHPVASKADEGRVRVPDPEAGTYSNLLDLELSVSAITKARTQGTRFVTPDGLPYAADYDTVLVGPELEEKAAKLFGSDARLRPTKDPENNTNAANPVHDINFIVVGGGYEGFSGKQWAICDRTLMKELANIVYITKPKVLQSQLDNPLIDEYTAYADFGMGWGDARQIIFSNPA